MKELEEQCVCVCVCVCVWNFAANLVKILRRHFSCLTKHTGRTVWAKHIAMSGLSILKRAEYRSVKIPGLNDLPHQQTMTMSREFVLCLWKSLFNCCWWSGHQHRILPSNFYWKTSDASHHCKICTASIDWWADRNCLPMQMVMKTFLRTL